MAGDSYCTNEQGMAVRAWLIREAEAQREREREREQEREQEQELRREQERDEKKRAKAKGWWLGYCFGRWVVG